MYKFFTNIFVLSFLIISCASIGNSKKSTAAQRAVETKEYNVDKKTLMTSSIGAFQDLGFTIDTISEEFGLITASKVEEKKEDSDDDGLSAGQIVGLVLVLGALLAIADKLPDNGNNTGGGGDKVVVKDYKLTATITVKSINEQEPYLSSLRVNFGGAERKRSVKFFKNFYNAIDKSLFLDQPLVS
tara:strand:- start:230 stop:787 length:558 start_codon:yes stop_codon:yes gene_type:complete